MDLATESQRPNVARVVNAARSSLTSEVFPIGGGESGRARRVRGGSMESARSRGGPVRSEHFGSGCPTCPGSRASRRRPIAGVPLSPAGSPSRSAARKRGTPIRPSRSLRRISRAGCRRWRRRSPAVAPSPRIPRAMPMSSDITAYSAARAPARRLAVGALWKEPSFMIARKRSAS